MKVALLGALVPMPERRNALLKKGASRSNDHAACFSEECRHGTSIDAVLAVHRTGQLAARAGSRLHFCPHLPQKLVRGHTLRTPSRIHANRNPLHNELAIVLTCAVGEDGGPAAGAQLWEHRG